MIQTTLVPGAAWPAFVFTPQLRGVEPTTKVKSSRLSAKKREGRAKAIVAYVEENPGKTSNQIAEYLGTPLGTITTELYRLEQAFCIRSVRSTTVRSKSGMLMLQYWPRL